MATAEQQGDPAAWTGHVIVCGLDGIGVTIVGQLQRAGQRVVVLEEYATALQLASVSSLVAGVIGPQGSVEETLAAAGVRTAAAVVCVVAQDLRNVQIALQARQMNPAIRVVSQLGNTAVRRAMAADNGPGAVIDGAVLAAPAIVEACLGLRRHQMDVEDTTFVAATVPVEEGTLRSAFGDLAPVAVTRPGLDPYRPEVIACPGRDFAVLPGDLATLLGTPEELESHGIAVPRPVRVPRERSGAARWATVRAVLAELDRGLYRALGVLAGLVVVSTLLLWWQFRRPGLSLLNALYFSVETVSTVGYGDFRFVDQSPWLRVWAVLLMLSGISMFAIIMAYVADFLISRRLNHSLGRRRARRMSGHVVVVGLGAFGLQTASALLEAGRHVVVIESDERNRFLAEAAALGLPVVFGDATSAEVLLQARLREAAAIAILTSDDMVNIETGMAVRDLLSDRWSSDPVPVVLRVFDRSLSRTIAARFGFRDIVSIEEITAPWFVAAALGLEVMGGFTVSGRAFTLGRLNISAGGALDGVAMAELSASTRVIALRRYATGVLEHPPRRGTRFAAGDTAYLVGPNEELLDMLRVAGTRVHPQRVTPDR